MNERLPALFVCMAFLALLADEVMAQVYIHPGPTVDYMPPIEYPSNRGMNAIQQSSLQIDQMLRDQAIEDQLNRIERQLYQLNNPPPEPYVSPNVAPKMPEITGSSSLSMIHPSNVPILCNEGMLSEVQCNSHKSTKYYNGEYVKDVAPAHIRKRLCEKGYAVELNCEPLSKRASVEEFTPKYEHIGSDVYRWVDEEGIVNYTPGWRLRQQE